MNITNLSQADLRILDKRQLTPQDIDAFSSIIERSQRSQHTPQAFLQTLEHAELAVLQKANSLADPINLRDLSTEGATNLLAKPSGEGLVDLNNDGLVEVGIAKSIHFPPVNAPQYIKDAWDKATEGMSFGDKATLQLTMHHVVYGTHIGDQPSRPALPPSQQWSQEGVSGFLGTLYSNLDFRVGMGGWTPYNRTLKEVYSTFETELESHFGAAITPQRIAGANSGHATSASASASEGKTETEQEDRLAKLNQLLIDARLGIDREKIEELEKEMEAVKNDPSLTPAEKAQKLQAIQEEIERVIEEARRQTTEQEKRKAMLSPNEKFGENQVEQYIRKRIAAAL